MQEFGKRLGIPTSLPPLQTTAKPPSETRLVTPFSAFATESFDAADSLWGDALLVRAGGYLILGGDGGVGKTILLVNLAIHLAAGVDRFLGFRLPARPVPVLFLEAEGSRSRFRDWVVRITRNLGFEPADLPLFFKTREATLDLAVSLQIMLDQSKAELAVLDPIGSFFTGNENDTEAWREGVTAPLRRFSESHNTAFAFCDHYSKPNENRSGRHKIRGSAAKIQDCGAALRLEIGDAGKASRLLYVDRVRDGELPELDRIALTLDLKTGIIAFDSASSSPQTSLDPSGPVATLPSILSAISELTGGSASTNELIVALENRFSISKAQAERAISSALDARLIERHSRGKYRLPGTLIS